jgi:hypothetical protein
VRAEAGDVDLQRLGVAGFLQDKTALERGLFDKENTLPEELTQLRMGKIVRERYVNDSVCTFTKCPVVDS